MNRKWLAIIPYLMLLVAMVYIRGTHSSGQFTLEDLFLALALCAATVGPTLIADSITKQLALAKPLWKERQDLTVHLKAVRKRKAWAQRTHDQRMKEIMHDKERRTKLGALYDRAAAQVQ